jgi:ubiquinone/menaquinone biosynthesis C-methylase UbiE
MHYVGILKMFLLEKRFVVLAFRAHEWPFVISEIRRVLKDGGCFQCIEMDMRVCWMYILKLKNNYVITHTIFRLQHLTRLLGITQ